MDIKNISTDLILPNTYNPNVVQGEVLAKLRVEIANKGLTQPITVRSSGNGYEIIDGYHRWLICRELGFKEIPCLIQEHSDNEAKIKCLQLNYLRGSSVPIKLASLIHSLNREMRLEDLEKRLPYDKPQLMDSLELLKLPEDFASQLKERALKEMEELPFVMAFVVHKSQAQVIEEAINIARQELPDGTKNSKALALERICAEYIASKDVKTKTETSVEAG